MKKCVTVLGLLLLILAAVSGCTGPTDVNQDNQADNAEPLTLVGEWQQVNSESEDSYQIATITADAIEIYWYSPTDETKALYWAGTYEAPTTADQAYSWDSVNDTSKTDTAILASTDESKTFTYENGQISYEVSALGLTTTVKLERISE